MMNEFQALLDRYWAWLRDETALRQVGDWVEITTPYLDRHNDCLQIYASRRNHGFVLTDDGSTIVDLEQSGCSLDTPKRQALLQMTLNGFGVRIREATKALEVRASVEDFALRKHNLLQAMLAVNDLFHLASPAVASLFLEDVVAWLDACEIRYTPQVRFAGRSGYDHSFDAVIPRSPAQPERILRVVNRPDRNAAQTIPFAWLDTKEVRPRESRAYAILNDSKAPVPEKVVSAMRNYGVRPVPWSERDGAREELAA